MNIYLLLCLLLSIVCAVLFWACCRVGAIYDEVSE